MPEKPGSPRNRNRQRTRSVVTVDGAAGPGTARLLEPSRFGWDQPSVAAVLESPTSPHPARATTHTSTANVAAPARPRTDFCATYTPIDEYTAIRPRMTRASQLSLQRYRYAPRSSNDSTM